MSDCVPGGTTSHWLPVCNSALSFYRRVSINCEYSSPAQPTILKTFSSAFLKYGQRTEHEDIYVKSNNFSLIIFQKWLPSVHKLLVIDDNLLDEDKCCCLRYCRRCCIIIPWCQIGPAWVLEADFALQKMQNCRGGRIFWHRKWPRRAIFWGSLVQNHFSFMNTRGEVRGGYHFRLWLHQRVLWWHHLGDWGLLCIQPG